MNQDESLLIQKIDHLTEQLEMQHTRLSMIELAINGSSDLTPKLNYLIDQFELQLKHQEELNELKDDLIPVANHMIKLSIDELADIGNEFQAEDLLFLIKRLLRDTHLLVSLLDRLEAGVDLIEETQQIGQGVFNQAVVTLDRLERSGYFNFAREGWKVVDRIVTEFSEEDIQALGENVVTIINTVKNLTQPEIMSLTNNALKAFQEEPVTEKDISMFALLRDLSDPQVRRGLARLINLIKVIADQPENKNN